MLLFVACTLTTLKKVLGVVVPVAPGPLRMPAQAELILFEVIVLPVEAPVHVSSRWMPDSSEPLIVLLVAVLLLLHKSIPS